MVQARDEMIDFSYGSAADPLASGAAHDPAGLPARVSVFCDTGRERGKIAKDLQSAGFRLGDCGCIADLVEGPIARLGDVVIVDCAPPAGDGLDGRSLAALARLDMRVARSGAHLIVSTSMDALEDVFAVLDQSRAQILVRPTRAERIVAVGRVMASVADGRVREMSEQDRLSLLHLSQAVEAIAHKLEGLSGDGASGHVSHPLDRASERVGGQANAPTPLFNSQGPALPDPRAVRQMIAARQARARFFDSELFADPAWDMLLDLTAAHGEGARVSVTSLCIAAAVPATTALRWIKQMVDTGIFKRVADEEDRRRAFIELSDNSIEAMSRYFEYVDAPLARAA